MPKKPFVFNDEEQRNSYGFLIPNAGISLARFNKNPIMLDNHYNSNGHVLGKWENYEIKGSKLQGYPVFDSEDNNVAQIEGKVERGFINSCSMGVSFHREDLKYVEGVLVLSKCELYEVSITPIPSNANAIRLYSAETGELMEEKEVQELCLSITKTSQATPNTNSETNTKNQNTDMKIVLTQAAALALGLPAGQTEVEQSVLSEKIVQLSANKNAAELQLSGLKQAQEQQKVTAVTTKVEAALKAGKITADNKDKFLALGVANEELLDSTLDALPAKKTFSAQVTSTGGDAADLEVKTAEDFQKLSHNQQMEFKASNPTQYIKIHSQN